MSNNISIESKVIERFFIKAKQERYLTFIKSEKTRVKFINDLSHMNFLRKELFDKVEGSERNFVRERIKVLGNLKECYVISGNSSIDRKWLDIEQALIEVIGSDQGSLLVFGDAEILYSEGEGFNNRLISKH